MSRLERIRVRLEGATPGPWQWQWTEGALEADVAMPCDLSDTGLYYIATTHTGDCAPRDAALIAHAPADLRDLLALAEAVCAVMQQEQLIARLEKQRGSDIMPEVFKLMTLRGRCDAALAPLLEKGEGDG